MTASLRIVYAGTPEFAVPALETLAHSPHRVVAVYTQPDRPAGRGRQLKPSAVKDFALRHSLPVEQPLNFRSEEAIERLRRYEPDVMVVAAYGLLLPQIVLDIPALACVNIHASLLPRWRGAAPIQRALLAGDAETGITLMRMAAGLDTGPILSMLRTPIAADDNAADLHDRLADLGARSLISMLNDLPTALAHAQPQPEEGVTYAKKLDKAEAVIDWSRSAVEIDRQIRAFNPWPVAETLLQGKQFRIWKAHLVQSSAAKAAAGEILSADPSGISVATADGVLNLDVVQIAGRKAMPAAEFANAQALDGVVLGN